MTEPELFTPPCPLNTAVLFLVFNRLDTTKEVFQAIRKAEPPRLYVAADGARAKKAGEAAKVNAVRDYILDNIDWECQVVTLLRDENLGCKYAVSTAISWFFENEEQGIILEDDCLPSQSFFWYCEDLLNRFRENRNVFSISGDSCRHAEIEIPEDYGFCKYPLIWGWASWADRWCEYDVAIEEWPKIKDQLVPTISTHKATRRFWKDTFEAMFRGEIDTWDYQVSFLAFRTESLCVVPKQNMIKNIGFGADATHTFDVNSQCSNSEIGDVKFPLAHNFSVQNSLLISDFYDRNVFARKDILTRVFLKLLSFI